VPVFNNTPLIVQTFKRLKTSFKKDERILIIPEALKKLTRRYLGKERMITEPVRRNTGPAICLAAMQLFSEHGDAIMHVMPADHIISPQNKFLAALNFGGKLAQSGNLVTYGIVPDRPETGYGYVKIDKKIKANRSIIAFKGAGFTEKPSLPKAKKYLKSKRYLWNSGIFTFSIGTILNEMKKFIPHVYHNTEKFLRTGNLNYFKKTPDISIDYGVMEKSDKLSVIRADFRWDDVGSWLALERFFRADHQGNIILGDIKGLEIRDTIMYTSDNIPLRVYDVKNMIIVVSSKGILVCSKKRAAALKELLRK
jgi:mannose-1-phosphate guanylyltransferase/mannose-6-phosphate isomerase